MGAAAGMLIMLAAQTLKVAKLSKIEVTGR
jgi:hypothetical protein